MEINDSRLPARFWKKIDASSASGCWIWRGASRGKRRPSIWWHDDMMTVSHLVLEVLGNPLQVGFTVRTSCGVEECVSPAHIEVTPMAVAWKQANKRPMPSLESILAKLTPAASGCLEFAGKRTVAGYGGIIIGGKQHRAHRFLYELVHGKIPDELVVMHTCDNPPCCNIEHLRLGTVADNNRDRDMKGRRGKRGSRGSASSTSARST